jgi:DNA primase catalytic subunit
MPKLTLKQRKFIKSYIENANATQAAKDAGFNCNSEESFGEMGHRMLKRVEGNIEAIMSEIGLDDVSLAKRLLEGADAGSKDKPNWWARVKFTELALKAKGLLKDRVDHVASGTITIRVKGRDPQKMIEVKPVEIDAKGLEIPEKVE